MEESYLLLSSMSPKITNNVNTRRRVNKPTKLALKRNIRRSSIFDHMKATAPNNSIIIVDVDSEVSSKYDESPSGNDEDIETKYGGLSKSRYLEISKWTKQVIAVNSPSSLKSDLRDNVVQSDNKNFSFDRLKSDIDNICDDADKLLQGLNSSKVEEELLTPRLIPNQNGTKSAKSPNSIICISSSSDIIEDSDEQNDSQQNVLDEVYGKSWRKVKPLVLSEPRSSKKFSVFSILSTTPKTETKNSKMGTDINNYIQPRQKLLEDFRRCYQSPMLANLKKICDSDTSDDNLQGDIEKSKTRLSFTAKSESRNENLCQKLNELSITNTNIRKHKTEPIKVLSDNSLSSLSSLELEKKISVKVKRKVKSTRKIRADTSDDDVNILTGKQTKIRARKPRKNAKKVFAPEPCQNEYKMDGKCSFLASLSKSVKDENCDASAKIFRNNFTMYKSDLLKKLFKLYNEKVFNNVIHEDTIFTWSKTMTKTAGRCYNRLIKHSNGSVERKAKIELSIKVLDSADRLRDTLIHELCHAAVWIADETRDGHGPYFKAWGAKAVKVFPELPMIERCHHYAINSKFTYRCKDCGYCIGRHSKSIDMDRKRCGHCYGRFELLINKKTKNGEIKTVPVTPKKQPSAFALFVKENYATYKSPQLNHGQVMKFLGEKFNELKVSVCKE